MTTTFKCRILVAPTWTTTKACNQSKYCCTPRYWWNDGANNLCVCCVWLFLEQSAVWSRQYIINWQLELCQT